MEQDKPQFIIEHRGRRTHKVKMQCRSYWVYIVGNGYSVEYINRAFKLKRKITLWDLIYLLSSYTKNNRNTTIDATFTKESAKQFIDQLEALILSKRLQG